MSIISRFKNGLEDIVLSSKSFIGNPWKMAGAGLILLFLVDYAHSQNTLNFHVQSVPSMNNAHSGITLTEISGPARTHTETDSATGNGTIDAPYGTFELIIKTKGHRRYIDTITVNGNQDFDIQIPEWIPTISTYFTDAMDLANCLKDQYGSKGVPKLRRWHDDLQPIRLFQENMPTDTAYWNTEWNAAKNSILEKTDSIVKFREADADSVIGVKIHYMLRDSIPLNAWGYTTLDEYFPDRTPKHMTMLLANDIENGHPVIGRETIIRELCRVAGLFANSPDGIHVMYLAGGNFHGELSIDEGNALKIIYKLKVDTDTRKIKPINDSTITGIRRTQQGIPDNFVLEQNYPNPFNPVTNIKFKITEFGFVTLKIYDLLGKEVAIVVNEKLALGSYTRQWNASSFPSGMYYYRLQINNYTETKKLLLLK